MSFYVDCLIADNLSVTNFSVKFNVPVPMTEEVMEGLSKLSNKLIHNLCYSLTNVILIELARTISGCVARSGERRNAC
jgi:hypothetical protein